MPTQKIDSVNMTLWQKIDEYDAKVSLNQSRLAAIEKEIESQREVLAKKSAEADASQAKMDQLRRQIEENQANQ